MKLKEAIAWNEELKGELIREGRLEKAEGVQICIEAAVAWRQYRNKKAPANFYLLPGETKD